MARADDIRATYESAAERLFTDREAFAEYLAFSGRFYKLPSAQAITLHYDNPNAEMATDYDTWKRFGRQVKRGGWSTAVLAGAEIKCLFDISQTVGKDTPYQWKLDRVTAEEFVKRFSNEENRTFSGMTACINSLTADAVRERIDEIASSLDVLEINKTQFERSFLSMVRRVAAARCEWKSTFKYGGGSLDLSALDLINNTDEAEALLEQVQITAKNVLLSMERTIDNINYERGLKNGKSERNISRGSAQGMVRRGEEILSGNNDAREQNVQTGRGDVHIPSDNGAAADGRGAGTDEEPDKPFRQSVEGVYDGELSTGYPEAAGQNVVGADTAEDRSRGSEAERGDESEFRKNEPNADGRGGTAQMVGEADDAPTRANLRNVGERSEDGSVTSDNEENTLTAEDSSAVNYLSLKIAELSDAFVQKYDGDYREFTLANYAFNYALTHTGSEYANPEYDPNLSVRDNVEKMLRSGHRSYLNDYLIAIFKEAFEGRIIVDEGIVAGELMSRLAKLDKNRHTVKSDIQADISNEPKQMRLFPEPLAKKQQAELEKLTADLTDEFVRWEKVFLDGGSDAYYEDGISLELIRNHIIYDKHELEEKFPDNLPEIYYRETPPKYPNNYQSVKKGDTLRFEYGDFLVLSIEKNNEYTGEQTSNAFEEPFIIRNKDVSEDSSDRYYDIDGIYQTFETEKAVQEYADKLNSADEPVLDTISDFRARTDEHYKKLAGYSAHDAEELAKHFIRGAFRENGISAEVGEVVLYGSRCRGMEHNGSDLDFVAEIYSDLKEDALFNILHKTSFEIGGAAVDINPIRAEETGSLEDYLLGAERYLQQKGAKGKTVPEVQDYRIEETEPTSFGPKARYAANIAAIKTLNRIESENRIAAPDEQEILAQYVGWGGIPQAFDNENAAWANEYAELKELLTPDEYEAARGTVLTAHYTSPTVISAIYKALGNFGFKGGNVLEPAMGIGNFFGVMPEEMRSQSQMHGVELDEISGRIAKQLYPNADVQICGYENTAFSDNFFDAAVGNVPFGNYSVSDTRYNRENFLIHDYFFAKTLDKVAPGGVVAFITSKGTLDKATPKVREYLAKRADLIGAIRLPNSAFKANAGTEVTADIIFLQKREKMSVEKPDWCYTAEITEGISINQYFADHPEMILGEMKLVSGRYGEETACVPTEGADLEQQLDRAVRSLKRNIIVSQREKKRAEKHGTIPATADVRNFTYTEVDGKIYFRENNIMTEVELKGRDAARVRGLIGVRNAFYELVDAQRDACSDEALSQLQSKLNAHYEAFVKSFGYIGDIKNRNVFGADDSCNALCGGLETEDPETHETVKTDIFTKRTIKPFVEVTHTDTPLEALYVSLDARGFVDIDYMSELCGISGEKIANELWENGFIFKNPETKKYEEAAEYLSGYVRDKLKAAQKAAEENPEYERNIAALEKVQPEKLGAGDISVRIGVPWVTIEDYCDFFREYAQGNIKSRSFYGNDTVLYRSISGEYKITNKGGDNNRSVAATSSFGTARMNSLEIFENLLNNRDMMVRDAVPLHDSKTKYVLNKKETQLAQEKARQMKEAFPKWLWEKQERREKYVEIYNELFNSLVGREYDGSHQTFPGMNPFIELNEHQKNAVMRCKLGGNTLLTHCVGAGKTFEMAAAVMEKRRLGLINKACIVVPKHLVGQTSAEWLRLYPQANILTATEKDFDKNHRQKFIGRCCTGDYDAVIMSYQQFQKIPMSVEYQRDFLMKQIDEITGKIGDFKNTSRAFYADEKRSVKDLEIIKKRLNTRLQKLFDTPRDTSLSFEQLGFDCIVADEAHNYKNGLVVTKMKNVSGIGSKAAKKCEDFLMKTDYLNEKFGERNLILASGTPISNSMTELYIMQKYMRPSALQKQGLQNFDDWASTFGEVVTQLELKPAGDGFRMKKRFAKFVNLAELMQAYKDFADIRTAEMLNLPVPEIEGGKPQVISAKPDDFQKVYMQILAERSEAIHNGSVDPTEDNMLKITGEARLLGLDARCLNPEADNSPTSKVNLLVDKVMEIYEETTEQKGVQAIFCDIAINGGAKPTDEIEVSEDGEVLENTELSAEQQGEILAASKFSVYDYIKAELIRRGIPENEICFAGDAKNQGQRGELCAQLREGTKRIVLASTSKMGTGANIQTRLCALHNLDIPWKPADFSQRIGRIIRQGNSFPTVKIFNYVTEGTFDAYMLNLIVTKQKFISQLMSGKTPARTCEDVDEIVLNYSEMQAIASGDPRIKEKIQLDTDVSRLRLLESEHLNKRYRLEDRITFCQARISIAKKQLDLAKADKRFAEKNALPDGEFKIVINGKTFTERKEAGAELRKAQMRFLSTKKSEEMGEYCRFKMSLNWGLVSDNQHTVTISLTSKIGKGLSYSAQLELQNDLGNITRLENILKLGIDRQIDNLKYNLARNEKDLSEAERTKDVPFEFADELAEKSARLAILNVELGVDKKDETIFDDECQGDNDNRGKGRDDGVSKQNKKPKRPKH